MGLIFGKDNHLLLNREDFYQRLGIFCKPFCCMYLNHSPFLHGVYDDLFVLILSGRGWDILSSFCQ